jgi:hypothetical protein
MDKVFPYTHKMPNLIEKQQNRYAELLADPKFSSSSSNEMNFPNPSYEDLAKVKAIILGADTTNPGKEELTFAFGLEDHKSPYFLPF